MSANSLNPTSLHYLFHSIKLSEKQPRQHIDEGGTRSAGSEARPLQKPVAQNQTKAAADETARDEMISRRVVVTDLNSAGLSFITEYDFKPGDVLSLQLEVWGQTIELEGAVKSCTSMKGLYQYELNYIEPCAFKKRLLDLLVKVMTYYEDDPRYPEFHDWALQLITGKHPDETERNHGRT